MAAFSEPVLDFGFTPAFSQTYGGGPRFMKAGRGLRARVLYKRTDIIDWLEANAYHSTSEYPVV